MKPIKFKGHNTIIKNDSKEFYDIPIFAADTAEAQIVMCYKLSFIEKLRVLFTGRVWVSVLSYQRPINPMFIGTIKKEVIK